MYDSLAFVTTTFCFWQEMPEYRFASPGGGPVQLVANNDRRMNEVLCCGEVFSLIDKFALGVWLLIWRWCFSRSWACLGCVAKFVVLDSSCRADGVGLG
jgi:hypothetical protein